MKIGEAVWVVAGPGTEVGDDGNSIVTFDSEDMARGMIPNLDKWYPDHAPHRVVRVRLVEVKEGEE